jgi:hypothetical protein
VISGPYAGGFTPTHVGKRLTKYVPHCYMKFILTQGLRQAVRREFTTKHIPRCALAYVTKTDDGWTLWTDGSSGVYRGIVLYLIGYTAPNVEPSSLVSLSSLIYVEASMSFKGLNAKLNIRGKSTHTPPPTMKAILSVPNKSA